MTKIDLAIIAGIALMALINVVIVLVMIANIATAKEISECKPYPNIHSGTCKYLKEEK